ncbi:embryonal Fyn-associated substrate isoform X3 [Trachemys scripta elegans]|uniref:embryonal Fyn-associated substrate isoform X3 n=1 Tax=Trachemys scripta elegans TaxID=31138 RepID=UPI001556396E|nr:embryonal Fyn-associated substrate isoform X3 [Trachemys scripta elegans]
MSVSRLKLELFRPVFTLTPEWSLPPCLGGMSPVLGDTGLPPSSTGSTGSSDPRPSQHWGSLASLPAGPEGPRPICQPILGVPGLSPSRLWGFTASLPADHGGPRSLSQSALGVPSLSPSRPWGSPVSLLDGYGGPWSLSRPALGVPSLSPGRLWGSPASLPAGSGGPWSLSQPALGVHCSLCPQAQLARALFDNVAECPEELSFRRGDLMLVLQPEVPGLAGWHLCSLHGQQGIVPANRVRILPESGPSDLSPVPRKESAPAALYDPPRGQRRSSAGQKEEQQEVYDVPCSLLRDAPLSDTYDTPSPFPKQVAEPDTNPYNVPPPAKPPPGQEEEEEEEEGREEEPGPVYATPSNLRRASALLNLYESPEELLGGEYDLPGPSPPEAALGGLSLGEAGGVGGRPRLPSAESLSRRPLPALPSPGAPRKGSIQDRPLPPPPPRLGGLAGGPDEGAGDGHSEYEGIRLAEEYDYVHLKGTGRLQPPATDCDPPEEVTSPRPQPETPLLLEEEEVPPSPEDAQLLQFYAGQCRTHYATLLAATEALLASAGANQPPGVFVPHGRFVLVTAHKLVFVGDTLARQAASAPLRARVGAAASALCQALKGAVLSVKGAALSYPSAPAARLLQERLAELSRRALGFTSLLSTLAPS